MWIKICGNTNLEDARIAVDAGADALGFVFAPSPRQVTVTQAARIAAELPGDVERIGVFVDADFSAIAAAVEACGLTGVQLHRSSEEDLPSRLRRHFAGRTLSIIRVIGWRARRAEIPGHDPARDGEDGLKGAALFDRRLEEWSRDPDVDAVLVDSLVPVDGPAGGRIPGKDARIGGGGVRFPWRQARDSFERAAPHLRLIVAGGLRPENVEEAISTLRPWGVDVVSGVESAPGKKDRGRLLAFLQAARKAAGRTE